MTREEAIHILDNLKPTNTKSSFDAYVVGEAITMAIKALEQESKTGHWIDSSNGWMCSECKTDNTFDTNYCPNCGCNMVEPQESEEE